MADSPGFRDLNCLEAMLFENIFPRVIGVRNDCMKLSGPFNEYARTRNVNAL